MPLAPASVVAAEPWSPLTAARPEPGEPHSPFPPSAATCAAKSAGTEPLKDTMWRMFAEEAPRATEANWGARAAAAGSGETRASYAHAAAATRPSVANRGTDLTSDTGRLAATGDREHGADSEGQQAGLRARGRCQCQDCVKSCERHFPTQKLANTRSSTSSGVTTPIRSSSAPTAARRWVAAAAASTPPSRATWNASTSARARSNAPRWRARVTTGSTSPNASRRPYAASASLRRRSARPSPVTTETAADGRTGGPADRGSTSTFVLTNTIGAVTCVRN